jgi:UDP-perosamine 4-acetyltransferase
VFYGGGGLAKVAIDILTKRPEYQIDGIVVDEEFYASSQPVLGIPVVGTLEELEAIYRDGICYAFNAVGFKNGRHYRRDAYNRFKEIGFTFINVIHESSVIEPSVRLGEGNLIFPGAIIESGVHLGNNCIINANAVLSHDSTVKSHCHISSGTVLAGNVTVGENTLIGQLCSVFMNLKIGSDCLIENGVHVFNSISPMTHLKNATR